MSRRIEITPGFLLLLTAVTVVCGVRLTVLTALAALLHEMGHITAVWLAGGSIGGFRMGLGGAELTVDGRFSFWSDAMIALAGPVASGLGALTCGAFMGLAPSDAVRELAGLNILYCGINLIPASPLDGGRAVYDVSSALLGPDRADRLRLVLDIICVTAALAGSAFVAYETRGNLTPMICSIILLNSCCKSAGFRVK